MTTKTQGSSSSTYDPGRLMPFIGDSAFARKVMAEMHEAGYVVLPGVFSNAEADTEYDRMWGWVEKVSRGIRRRDPKTWERRPGNQGDPWPCNQRDMMQLHQAGWVFSGLREAMAERVFEPLYGTQKLHCSKDGFTLQRPTSKELNLSPNDHFDQAGDKKGLWCIQGSIALTNQDHDDGCFLCWPGSHKFHQEITKYRGTGGARKDWMILNQSEKQWLEDEKGVHPLRVPVKKGDVILWRSDLAHKGAPPIGRRENFRAVVYVCMLPAALTAEPLYEKKRLAYEGLETGSHWPNQEEWFAPRHEPSFAVGKYFQSPPELSARLRLLYGLDRYYEEHPEGTPAQCPASAVVAAAPREETKSHEDTVAVVASKGEANAGAAAGAKPRRWGQKKSPLGEVNRAEANGVKNGAEALGGGGGTTTTQKKPEKTREEDTVEAKKEGGGYAAQFSAAAEHSCFRTTESEDPVVPPRRTAEELAELRKLAKLNHPEEQYRELRKLRKAVREIEELEGKLASGEKLRQNQVQKIGKKPEYKKRLAEMVVDDEVLRNVRHAEEKENLGHS